MLQVTENSIQSGLSGKEEFSYKREGGKEGGRQHAGKQNSWNVNTPQGAPPSPAPWGWLLLKTFLAHQLRVPDIDGWAAEGASREMSNGSQMGQIKELSRRLGILPHLPATRRNHHVHR